MIKKIILSLIAILGVLIGYFCVEIANKDQYPKSIDTSSELKSLNCDLNTEPCVVDFKGKSIKFEINPKPIFSMKPVIFDVYGLDELGFKDLALEFYGLNMDMGKIKAKLDKKEDRFSSKIVISSCVLDVMRYRFEITSGGKPTGLFVDFDLKF